jgi:GNAT superfamily N-acetyltransferase
MIDRVDMATDRARMIALSVEYLTWVADETDAYFSIDSRALVGMPMQDYVEQTFDKVCAEGTFLVVRADDDVVAMGALRQLGNGIGEIKRMYVRPTHRGQRLGEALLRGLIGESERAGTRSLLLDSAPFMSAAHKLYRAHGFVDRPPYPETEVPEPLRARWLFMERTV